jgi:hypothetical protein
MTMIVAAISPLRITSLQVIADDSQNNHYNDNPAVQTRDAGGPE